MPSRSTARRRGNPLSPSVVPTFADAASRRPRRCGGARTRECARDETGSHGSRPGAQVPGVALVATSRIPFCEPGTDAVPRRWRWQAAPMTPRRGRLPGPATRPTPGSTGRHPVRRAPHAGRARRGNVLLAHCFNCSKDSHTMTRLARGLSDAGYAVLRFDFIASGRQRRRALVNHPLEQHGRARRDSSRNCAAEACAPQVSSDRWPPTRRAVGGVLGGLEQVTPHVPPRGCSRPA